MAAEGTLPPVTVRFRLPAAGRVWSVVRVSGSRWGDSAVYAPVAAARGASSESSASAPGFAAVASGEDIGTGIGPAAARVGTAPSPRHEREPGAAARQPRLSRPWWLRSDHHGGDGGAMPP